MNETEKEGIPRWGSNPRPPSAAIWDILFIEPLNRALADWAILTTNQQGLQESIWMTRVRLPVVRGIFSITIKAIFVYRELKIGCITVIVVYDT